MERWLVLDRPVWLTLLADSGDSRDLLRLRLEHGLAELAPLPEVARRLGAIARAGFGNAHLVVERLDAALLSRLRPLVPEGMQVHVHDWYGSPLDVMAGLDAPDAAIIERLRRRDAATRLTIWPPVGPLGDGDGFRVRLRDALMTWEQDARAEHGEVFECLYGGPIAWHLWLPDESAGRARRPGTWHGDWIRAWVLRPGFGRTAGDARAFGLAGAMSESPSGGQALDWTYRLDSGGELTLRLELPSRPGANVEVLAALGPGTEAPGGFSLIEETGAVIVSALTPHWTAAGAEGTLLVSVHSFSDEFGELRARFHGLRAQPELLLLPA